MFGIGNPELGVLMLALFVVLIMLGFPIAFTLMALGIFFGYFAMGDLIFSLAVQRTYSVMTNDVLISIPLFVFMGYVIERANILDRLFRSLQLAAGPVPGALALATLATCAIFATATGIVGAVVTLMGLLAFPAMLRAGYDVKISAGVVCAGGCLGILIPPSVMLILYGATAGVSVVKLYAGAFFPGLMLAGLYMLYIVISSMLNPKLAPRLPEEERNVPFGQVLIALATSFLPLALLIAAALGPGVENAIIAIAIAQWPSYARLARAETLNEMRDGKLALISPVSTSTDGRWVARIRWIPTARAICAMRQIASSTSRGATIIRSASSSITTTMNGMCSYRCSMPGGIRSVPSARPAS